MLTPRTRRRPDGKLQLAFLGGAYHSAVGRVHRIAIDMDQRFELAAGCFSRSPEANLASAKAQQREAERALERRQDLLRRGVSTQADFDQAETARDVAAASVRQNAANLDVARLPARPDEIKASENAVEVLGRR